MRPLRLAAVAVATLIVAGCASTEAAPDASDATTQTAADDPAAADAPGVRSQAAADVAPLLDDPDVVVLDIRTPEEVAEARLPGEVVNIDFYEPDFQDQLAALDPDASYVMYCRSGNRSGTARGIMSQLGFRDVVDIDGGIVGWSEAGLPIVQ